MQTEAEQIKDKMIQNVMDKYANTIQTPQNAMRFFGEMLCALGFDEENDNSVRYDFNKFATDVDKMEQKINELEMKVKVLEAANEELKNISGYREELRKSNGLK